ncbi:MAG: hypothetical protein ACYDH4_10175 [Candidatus Cryosericum sp.]
MREVSGNMKPECQLTESDGNVFAIMGNVRRALKRAGQTKEADEFLAKARACGSYDEVLRLCEEYVEVT